jgi:TRAP-type mannitol/chloroaromatic compound transport system permease small subunit
MQTFVDWIRNHLLTAVLIVGAAYTLLYVFRHRKDLFYKK